MTTLRQIRNFLALAAELHFARAAKNLGISQAALSADIRKLEVEIGCRLFDRSDKWTIRLTASGAAYLGGVRNILPEMEAARRAACRAARGETGNLVLMVVSSVYDFIDLNGIFRRMISTYPELRIRICDSSPSHIAAALRDGTCDLGFLPLDSAAEEKSTLKYMEMFRMPLMFVIPVDHPLARKKKLAMTDFRDCRFIMPSERESPRLRAFFEDILIEHGHFKPLVVQEANGPLATQQLAAAGLGIGIVPENFRKRFGRFVVCRKIPCGAERVIVAAWNENNPSPALENLLRSLTRFLSRKNG